MKMVTKKCGKEGGTCGDLKLELEVELHRTKESMEHAELMLKKGDFKSKQEIDKLQELKCKVIEKFLQLSIIKDNMFQLSLASTCLSAAEEEKEILKKDFQNLSISKEMMIKSDWETR